MEHKLIEQEYIPLDKSWIIRMSVLDLLNGYDDAVRFLEKQKSLSDDLKALHRALVAWKTDKSIDVGESGTLYRFLKFASWKLGLNNKFILHGTLKNRKICDDKQIIKLSELDDANAIVQNALFHPIFCKLMQNKVHTEKWELIVKRLKL